MRMRRTWAALIVAALSAGTLAGCRAAAENDSGARVGTAEQVSRPVLDPGEGPNYRPAPNGGLLGIFHHPRIPAGTVLRVRLETGLSSASARSGDEWSGVTTFPVVVEDKVLIPEGSVVRGVVAEARSAHRGTRATLQLALRAVVTKGREHRIVAYARPVVAGSPRTRNLGGIAVGTAAGALIGKAVADRPLAGALIGGGAATGVVYASKGYQVRLPAGTALRFRTSEEIAFK